MVSERVDGDPWHPLVDYALDELIQLRAALPPDLLARIIEERPVEGMILLSHVDDGTADGVPTPIWCGPDPGKNGCPTFLSPPRQRCRQD